MCLINNVVSKHDLWTRYIPIIVALLLWSQGLHTPPLDYFVHCT
jgi:hypothetical protein